MVILRWEESEDEQQVQLCDIQSDGRGRLKWESVKAFGAANVELTIGGPPSLCQGTQRKGLTKGLFKPGVTIPVVVFGKEQGMGILLLLVSSSTSFFKTQNSRHHTLLASCIMTCATRKS